MWVTIKHLGPIGPAALTFFEHKQTDNQQTSKDYYYDYLCESWASWPIVWIWKPSVTIYPSFPPSPRTYRQPDFMSNWLLALIFFLLLSESVTFLILVTLYLGDVKCWVEERNRRVRENSLFVGFIQPTAQLINQSINQSINH